MSADTLKEMKSKLDRLEATTGNSGAVPRTPKQLLLDRRHLEQSDKDHRYRWVSARDAQKIESRLLEGYVKVPDGEGGANLGGSLVLMKIPRERYLERVRANRQRHAERMGSHKREMEEVAESVARILRDKHGINYNAERILVSEV